MTVTNNFPQTVEVAGATDPDIDGVYSLAKGEPKWGFVYRKAGASESAASLRYGEEHPEVGGPGFAGWVIGKFSDSGVADIFARCIRSSKSPTNTPPQWEVKDQDGNFGFFPAFKARPMRESSIALSENRVRWRLEAVRDKVKYCRPGQGFESEAFTIPDVGEYKMVLYPFGCPASAPGCVSLALVRAGGLHRMLRFYLRIGNCVSGHKILAGSDFVVDFSRSTISGRLESLEAELNIVL